MAQVGLNYQDKTNKVTIENRSQQATAEDFNEIKTVVNANANDAEVRFQTGTFDGLVDTPSSKNNEAGKIARVASNETDMYFDFDRQKNHYLTEAQGDTVLEDGINYKANSFDGIFTVYMPDFGRMQIYFEDSVTNDITFNGNGVNIEGSATWVADASKNKHLYEFVYNAMDAEWKVKELDNVLRESGDLATYIKPSRMLEVDFNNKKDFFGINVPTISLDTQLAFINKDKKEVAKFRVYVMAPCSLIFLTYDNETLLMQEYEVTNGRWEGGNAKFTFLSSGTYEIDVTAVEGIYLMRVSDKFV